MNQNRAEKKSGFLLRTRLLVSGHFDDLKKTAAELITNPLNSTLSLLLIAVSIALPSIFLTLTTNFMSGLDRIDESPKINVYLREEVSIEEGMTVTRGLLEHPQVSEATFISADEALKEFQEGSNLSGILIALDENPLPHVVEVVPSSLDPLDVSNLVMSIELYDQVQEASINLRWLERLFAISLILKRLVFVLALILFLGVILVIAHTIGVAIQFKRQEIELMLLIGATHGFVKRPFRYLGFWYGFGGGLLAAVITELSVSSLSGSVEALAQSYRSSYALDSGGIVGILAIIVVGVFLGVVGASIGVSRHVKEIQN